MPMKKFYSLLEKKEIQKENPDEVESIISFLENEKNFINQIEENLKTLEEDLEDEKINRIFDEIKNLYKKVKR